MILSSLTFVFKCFVEVRPKYFSHYNVNLYRRKFCSNMQTNVKSYSCSKVDGINETGSARYNSRCFSNGYSYFSLQDYDCVGFDLDNTICGYNLNNNVTHAYEVLSEYLVGELGYDVDSLLKPLMPSDIDFLQKGLIIDTNKGNLLRVQKDGYIFRASYGSKFLSDEEIIECYGADRKWTVTTSFAEDPVAAWYGPSADKIRTLADYFDMPASLVLSRCIRHKTLLGDTVDGYSIWKSVLQALLNVYDRNTFSSNQGYFKSDVKTNPGQYYYKCRPAVKNWLKELKKRKVTFLITGSNVDHASHTASYCLGEDWRDYFDIVICYSRKPGFFVGNRDFLKLDGFTEDGPIKVNEIERGGIYSQGNWNGLHKLLCEFSKKSSPKCVYIGDNLIQDIFTVSHYTSCDTVAVAEELAAEYLDHPHKDFLVSNLWGSYFSGDNHESLWANVIRNHSKICIPSLDVLANKPFDYRFTTFGGGSSGYHSLESPLNLDAFNKKVSRKEVS